MPQYSPERRTALVLCGTGVHGAYHAGVLRALQEAGVKIDIMAGQGVGAAGATLAAIDGSPRLFEADGLWRSATVAQLYRWTWPVRAAAWLALVPVPLLCVALVAAPFIPLTITRVAIGVWGALIAALVAAIVMAERRNPSRRRAMGSWWWRVAGAPLDGQAARDLFAGAVWTLIHGAAPEARPSAAAAGRRYAEVLAEGLGQPGFRELMVIATDVDTRRDVIAAMLREPHRQEFLAARPGHERRADVLDLAGAGRDHALDLMAAALTPPVGCDPQLVTFAHDSFWRGETHRLCDRPGAVSRLLEELAIAGATQAIIVSAVPRGSAPHGLRPARLDVRHRIGDHLATSEAASLRDAMEMARLRFDSVYLISPAHNPLGAFDVDGAYDESSDRRQSVAELIDRAYEDAYHQFIEPVVGASGEHLAFAEAEPRPPSEPGIFGDADPLR